MNRPDQRDFAPAFAAQGQQGQHFGLRLRQAGRGAPAKPLPGDALMHSVAHQAGGQGVLLVMRDVKAYAQLGAGLAGTAFTHHRERRGQRGLYHLNLGLKLHGLRQQRLQHRHIYHPVELTHALIAGTEIELAAIVAPDLHLVHGRDGGGLRPAAQVLQQGLGRAVERIGAHVRGRVGLG